MEAPAAAFSAIIYNSASSSSSLFASFCAYASICKLFIVYHHHPNIYTLDVFAVMGVCITEIFLFFVLSTYTLLCVYVFKGKNCNFLLLSSLPCFVYLDTFFLSIKMVPRTMRSIARIFCWHTGVGLIEIKYRWDFVGWVKVF